MTTNRNDTIAIVWAFIAGSAGIFVGDCIDLLGLVIYASLISINYSVAAAADRKREAEDRPEWDGPPYELEVDLLRHGTSFTKKEDKE